jgi:small subunit ribosomal protein S1
MVPPMNVAQFPKTGGRNRPAGNDTEDRETRDFMATQALPTRDDFAALLNETFGGENASFEGRVVKGTITAIEMISR